MLWVWVSVSCCCGRDQCCCDICHISYCTYEKDENVSLAVDN